MPNQNTLIDELLEIAGCKPLNESQEEWVWNYGSFEDYLTKYNLEWVFTNAKRGSVWYPLIDARQYKLALDEFVKYGRLVRFPVDKIYDWVDILMKNSAIFENIRPLYGVDEYVPYIEVFEALYGADADYDEWVSSMKGKTIYIPWLGDVTVEGAKYTTDNMIFMLEVNGVYNALKLPDGAEDAWSDTQSYADYMNQFEDVETPEQALVLINKVLDVYHQRSDLASLFITGGREALTKISNG